MTWWIRVQASVTDTEPSEKMANQMNQHIEMSQIQYTDKVADESVAVQRQVSPRTTKTKAPEHQRDVQGEAITKYSWSEGKNTVNIYFELDGLDDVTDDAFQAESGKTNVSLTIASVAGK